MSAANAASQTEPSMEEILASIRRIIADDEAPSPARRDERRRGRDDVEATPAEPAARQEPAEVRFDPAAPTAEIRPLRLALRDPEPAVEEPATVEPIAQAGGFAAADAAAPEEFAAERESAPPLMSPDAASSIASHFETLAATMLLNDSGILRDYAQDMMRPMLKQWLDDNLPVIVERLVRAEIERVARGGRR